MPRKISAKRLKKLVNQLVDEHRQFGLKRLNLAVWYGDKEQTDRIHSLSFTMNYPIKKN
jgi:translation elongation factor EF-1beta